MCSETGMEESHSWMHYWCGHFYEKLVLKRIETLWETLWTTSHNCPFGRQKEKAFITPDLPVVKVCLTGIQFSHTTRLCLHEGREPRPCGFPGLQHQRTSRTGSENSEAWAQVRPCQTLPAQTGTGLQRAGHPSRGAGGEDFEVIHQQGPMQFLFSLGKEIIPSSPQ